MDDVTGAAGVGKGTLYRRFGDKAGLGIAVLDERERELQDAILRGPSPRKRLKAFVHAYLGYAWRNLELLVVAETGSPGARYRSGVYAGFRRTSRSCSPMPELMIRRSVLSCSWHRWPASSCATSTWSAGLNVARSRLP